MLLLYYYYLLFSFGSAAQCGLWPPRTTRFCDHTRRTTVGRTPLDERSVRHRDYYRITDTFYLSPVNWDLLITLYTTKNLYYTMPDQRVLGPTLCETNNTQLTFSVLGITSNYFKLYCFKIFKTIYLSRCS
jgi:hypothetical protein